MKPRMVGVQVSAQTAEAMAWLRSHTAELSDAFLHIHRGPAPSHPHRLSFLVPPMTMEDSFEPRETAEFFYVYVSAHNDELHLRITMEDMLRVFDQLGAQVSQFSFREIRKPKSDPAVEQ